MAASVLRLQCYFRHGVLVLPTGQDGRRAAGDREGARQEGARGDSGRAGQQRLLAHSRSQVKICKFSEMFWEANWFQTEGNFKSEKSITNSC